MAHPNRFSIYAGEPIARAIEGNENRSGRLNNICERYAAVIADQLSQIDLTRGEWCAIMDVANGAQMEVGDPLTWRFLWASMADADEMDSKWGIDRQALSATLRSMSVSNQIAVYEACLRFWLRPELPTDDALALSGVSIRKDI